MGPEQNRALSVKTGLPEDLKIKNTVSLGSVHVIETLWERLGLKRTFSDIARRKRLKVPYERALLAMTANRCVTRNPNWVSGTDGFQKSISPPVMD